jgi:hypothetical protein
VVVAANRSGVTSLAPAGGNTAALLNASLATFVGQEHEKSAAFGPHYEQKFNIRSADQLDGAARTLFDSVPEHLCAKIKKLESSGYQFAGFGKCGVPGKGKSAHLLFRPVSSDARPVSVFIQVDTGCHKLDRSRCFKCDVACAHKGTMLAWRDDAFDYFVFTCDDRGLTAVRDAFEAPTNLVAVPAKGG